VLSERPTPVRALADLGIWVKEDGAFGAGGWGGNKVRKLEWLIPDAQRRGRHSILTFGGLGTNWGLATALYAREHGLETALALVDQPIDAHVGAQLARLDASGARVYRTHTKARTVAMLPWLLARNARGGHPPYLLPAGGSSPVGALGYVEAAMEIAAQVEDGSLPEPAHAVVPVGTGGTAAGLALGFQLAGLRTRVVGVVVNDQLRLEGRVAGGALGLDVCRGPGLRGDRQPEAEDRDRGLVLVLLEEHPLQHLGALEGIVGEVAAAVGEVPEDRVGLGERTTVLEHDRRHGERRAEPVEHRSSIRAIDDRKLPALELDPQQAEDQANLVAVAGGWVVVEQHRHRQTCGR
jgi:D-cysteine desulfhydrase